MDYGQFLADAVHEPTQRESPGFDLTVAEIDQVTEPGRLDFGGDELGPAATEPLSSESRYQDDDYEWWTLDAGQYLLEYNETIDAEDVQFTLQPRIELLERGAFHPSLHVTDLPRVPLSVGGAGLHLKANARVSTLIAAQRS